MDLSIVIPVFNESESIESLIDEIVNYVKDLKYEIVVVDDYSSDNTLDVLLKLKHENLCRIIKHSENFGQSSAIFSGVKESRSKVIATLDGDGQNNPRDIVKLFNFFMDKDGLNNNILVAGNRINRKDSFSKRISSKYANKLRRLVLQDGVPDTGCGLKVFSRESYLSLPFFNHMHRYLPALFIYSGHEIISLPVDHRHRLKGSSKYGFNNRFWVGVIDLLGVRWLKNRAKIIKYSEL